MPTTEHDRECTYANNALETLLAARDHTPRCPQCRSDPSWCKTANDYLTNFERDFSRWQVHRGSGGVVSRNGAAVRS